MLESLASRWVFFESFGSTSPTLDTKRWRARTNVDHTGRTTKGQCMLYKTKLVIHSRYKDTLYRKRDHSDQPNAMVWSSIRETSLKPSPFSHYGFELIPCKPSCIAPTSISMQIPQSYSPSPPLSKEEPGARRERGRGWEEY